MEMKNKDQETKVPGRFWNKEDQTQSRAEQNRSGRSSHDNVHPSNQEFQLNFQWPCSSQASVEETSLISKVNIPSPSQSPVPGQWPNSQVQNSHVPPHFTQACMPLWPTQQPWYLPAAASYHSLTPPGTTNGTWPGTSTIKGDFSPGYQQRLPCYSYPIFCPYPGFPGTHGPLSWWGQPQLYQQPMSPFGNMNAGADGHFASSSYPSCNAAEALSNQRGAIQPLADISEKQQQRWDAQSEENAQLWSVIDTLKSELAEYKTRLTKLETGSLSPEPIAKGSSGDLSLGPTEKEPAGNLFPKPTEKEPCSGLFLKQIEKEPGDLTRVSLQGSGKRKRGRPRKQSASNSLIPFLDPSFGKKPAMLKERQS